MFQINKKNKLPLYRQLVNSIIQQIDEGILIPGERLLSERQLAQELGVNRSTIVRAYEELELQGFVDKKRNSGTYIAPKKEVSFNLNTVYKSNFFASKHHPQQEVYLTRVKQLIDEKVPGVIDTYTGELPTYLLPNGELPNLRWQEFLNEKKDELGYYPLRQEINKLVYQTYCYESNTNNMMITAGGQQSLYLLLQTLLKPGDTVAIESPSFFNGLSLLRSMAIKVIEIPVDQNGMQVEILKEMLTSHTIRLVLTNANFQNPTGSSMSRQRRQELIHLCQIYRIPLIEDDVFGQLAFPKTRKYPLLKELAPDQVIYIGSLSKILGKEIQLGWLDAPKLVLMQVQKIIEESESQLNIFPQVLATYALKNPSFNEEVMELREVLGNKKEMFIAELSRNLSSDISFIEPKGGYYMWLTFKGRQLKEEDWFLLLEEKVTVFPSFFITNDCQSCRVNFSRMSQEEIVTFTRRLGKTVKKWKR